MSRRRTRRRNRTEPNRSGVGVVGGRGREESSSAPRDRWGGIRGRGRGAAAAPRLPPPRLLLLLLTSARGSRSVAGGRRRQRAWLGGDGRPRAAVGAGGAAGAAAPSCASCCAAVSGAGGGGGVWEHLRRCGAACGVRHREHPGGGRVFWGGAGCGPTWGAPRGASLLGCGWFVGRLRDGRARGVAAPGVPLLSGWDAVCSRFRGAAVFGAWRGVRLFLGCSVEWGCFWVPTAFGSALRGAVPCEMGDRCVRSLWCWEAVLCFRGVTVGVQGTGVPP